MVMHLQRQLGERIDDNALDLEPVALIDRIVVAPWSVDLAMRIGLAAAKRLEPRHHLLDLLQLIARRHQHRIRGFNHDRVALRPTVATSRLSARTRVSLRFDR